MNQTIKFFVVKFRGGITTKVMAKTRTEAIKLAKARYLGHAMTGWEDVTEDHTAMCREELYHLIHTPDTSYADCLSPEAANYLAILLEQTGGE